MSEIMNRNLSFLKDLETQFRGTSFLLSSHKLDKEDSERVANAYTLWIALVCDLLSWKDITCTQYKGRIMKWGNLLRRSDVEHVFNLCKDTLQCLRLWDPAMGDSRRASFKHWLSLSNVVYHDPLLGPIWDLVDQFAIDFVFDDVNSALSFISRLTLVNISWIEESNLQAYIELEEEMKSWYYPNGLVEELRVQMQEAARHYQVGQPSHSSGATFSTKRKDGLVAKLPISPSWRNRQFCLAHDIPYDSTFLDPLQIAGYPSGGTTTKVLFVPKGINKKRIISPEPAFSVYLQHAVEKGLKDIFRRHPEFGYTPESQDGNCRLALVGSSYRNYGTIDLSEASDRVTYSLVKQTLHGTSLLWDLQRTRSTHAILPNDTTILLEKFAPMGSACCFPIESMIFSSVVRAAQVRVGRRTPFKVYGDDIVCHESCFDEVIQILDELHMKVNQDKTYHPYETFKESCGLEAHNGRVVNPLRISRFYDVVRARRHDPVMLNSLTDFCNRLYIYQAVLTRAYCIRELLQDYPGVQFGDIDSPHVWSDDPSNFHLKCRLDPDLQCVSYRSQNLLDDQGKGPDDLRYLVLLERYAQTERTQLFYPEDRIDVSIGPPSPTLKWGWRTPW